MYKSESFWNKLSKNYDKNAKDKAYHLIIKKSKKHFKIKDVILDFACATGLYSFAFSKQVKEIQALDISSKMIAIAKSKIKGKEGDNVIFSQTTLFDKKYKEASFDTVLGFNILLYFKDEKKILHQMNKLLKTDGLIITSTACLNERRTFIGVLSSSLIFLFKSFRILPYLKFYTMRDLEKTITNCGFNIIETDILIDKPATEYFIVAQKL